MRRNAGRSLLVAAVITMGATLAGCTTVKPWERGVLAHPSMDPEDGARACSEDFLGHTFDVREAAVGGLGRAGGGCGCN